MIRALRLIFFRKAEVSVECWHIFVWGSSTYMTIYDNTPRWIMQDCKTPSNWAYLLRLLVIFKFLQLTQLLCRVRYLRVKHMFSRWNCWPLGAPWRPRPDGWRLPKPYRQPHPRWVSRSSQWDALHTWDPLGHCRRRRAWSTPQFSHVRGAYRQLPPGKWVVHLCWAEFMKYEVSQQQDLSISESTMLTSRMTNEASVTVQLPVLHKRFDLILSNGPPNILGMQHFKRGCGKRYQRLQPCTNLFLETSHSTKMPDISK